MSMTDAVKYAILDTDFVSKANIIRIETQVLADEVLAFPGYRFSSNHNLPFRTTHLVIESTIKR